ncbi:hypothetical protein [Mycobacterium sp. B14F4]|uniref:hypothetical protein n=1 Tax=Mycobacterium sp. B14F4 TaxID=3153565 RepID=UPI00325FD947
MMKRATAGAVMGGALLFTGGMGVAAAQPLQLQDGLVNLAIGDVSVLNDVNVGVAAQISALLCDTVDVGQLGVLAEQIDSGAEESYTCTSEVGDITMSQNGSGNSENAPGAANRPAR